MLLKFLEEDGDNKIYGYLNTDRIEYFYFKENGDKTFKYDLYVKTTVGHDYLIATCISWQEHFYIMNKTADTFNCNNMLDISKLQEKYLANTFLEYCMENKDSKKIKKEDKELDKIINKMVSNINYETDSNIGVCDWINENLTTTEIEKINKFKREYFRYLEIELNDIILYECMKF